jgi:sterol carrier protein 2
MSDEVRMASVGIIPFTKLGGSETGDVMGQKAAPSAGAGQAIVNGPALVGVPIIDVDNNCSKGRSALFLARQATQAGVVDCALVLGFEEMRSVAQGAIFNDRPSPMATFIGETTTIQAFNPKAPGAAHFLSGAAGAGYYGNA